MGLNKPLTVRANMAHNMYNFGCLIILDFHIFISGYNYYKVIYF